MKMLQESDATFAGYQRNRLFRNNGGGSFTEVGYVTGTDRIEDGYVAAFTDYDRDGRVDLLLRNADPASVKRPFAPVTLLRNNGANKNGSLAVYLQGTRSLSFGAKLTLKAGGRTLVREIRAVTGAVQSEAAAFFGLGSAVKADSLEVRWGSGHVDRYTDLKSGHIVIVEGAAKQTEYTALAPTTNIP
jgi:hypothetical protein